MVEVPSVVEVPEPLGEGHETLVTWAVDSAPQLSSLPTGMAHMPFMYILECADHSLYVGSTTDLHARLAAHESGRGAAYTSRPGRRPVRLVYAVELPDVATAFYWEKRVQGWSRAKRWATIQGRVDLLPGLSRRRLGRPLQ